MKISVIIASLFLLTASQCRKDLLEFYFRCKVNGREYIPDGCTNCLRARLIGDTTFLLNENNGFETVLIGIINLNNLNREHIAKGIYILDRTNQSGIYSNSPIVNDTYRTNSSYTGQLMTTDLDKSGKIISGTFSFQAYNPIQDKIVNVTEGKFRLRYNTY